MPRFVIIVDWVPEAERPEALERARGAMALGGSSESVLEIVRPGFSAVVFSHESPVPALQDGHALLFSGGHGLPESADAPLLREVGRWLGDGDSPLPVFPERPPGRRCLVRWDPDAGELVALSEANGHAPLYLSLSRERAVLSSELKGIWAVRRGELTVDADTLLQLFTVGGCLDRHTPFREIECVPPGTALRLTRAGLVQRGWYEPAISEERGGDAERAAGRMCDALSRALEAERRTPRVTVALSGGMDSRFLLAGAKRTWERIDTVTFGVAGSTDVERALQVARRAGVENRFYVADGSRLPHWAPYGVWRSDGMLGVLHAHGMDAFIEHAPAAGVVLNGMGGDIVTGVFLRPGYLTARGGAARAARTLLGRRRFHHRSPEQVFKPELLRQVQGSPAATLEGIMARYPYERLGNVLQAYWVRHHCARLTVLGLQLEAPFIDYASPLADPDFVATATSLSLELRFMGRAYRRALARLAPEFMDIACERYGLAPRWPWPLLSLRGAARRLGIGPRPPLQESYAHQLRSTVLPWIQQVLLERETRDDGYFLPGYLETIVAEHSAGQADHATQLGMAATLELWRRIFVAGRTDLAGPPVVLPATGPVLRSTRDLALDAPAGGATHG